MEMLKNSQKFHLDKRGFEMNFAWIFGILVGVVILVIALYAANNMVETEDSFSETRTAKQLGILLNPLETGLEEASYALVGLPSETQIINECEEFGTFGKQIISVNDKKTLGDFKKAGKRISFFNKYLFSKKIEEGKNLHLIIKPLELPYKVADMVFATTENYCFVNPPSKIEEEIDGLNPAHIFQNESLEDCPENSRSVCFGGYGECDIEVNPSGNFVTKDDKTVYYVDSLVYGAIFADAEIYECQIKRLMMRNAELAYLYSEKSNFLNGKGCSSNLGAELLSFASTLKIEDEGSSKLIGIANTAKNLRHRNEQLECEIF